jgi:hypothetical protein
LRDRDKNMDFAQEKKKIFEVLNMKEQIDFDTRFQRGKTWRTPTKQYFMDTVRKDWRISKLVLWKKKENDFVCVDGQQRLRCIYGFINDDEFCFSEKISGGLAGKKFSQLDPEVRDRIKNFELDFDIIMNASICDVADFFIRLQNGAPLNSAEKLNAILGDMRDFVCEVAKHRFFTDIISVKDYRFSHRYLAAQIILLSQKGLHNLKYKDLVEVYQSPLEKTIPENIKKMLDYLVEVFTEKTSEISNRATIISLYFFVHLEFKKLKLDGKKELLRDFAKDFQKKLNSEQQLKDEERDSELQSYHSFVIQAADTANAIDTRHRILVKRFENYETEGII